jgi:hypothetical protein
MTTITTFAEAYNLGLETSELADKNHREIDAVFEKMREEIFTATQHTIIIERGISYRKNLSNLRPALHLAEMLERIPFQAVLAKNKAAGTEIPLAEYTIDHVGYPFKIKWTEREEVCLTQEELDNTLKEILASPSIGRKIREILSSELESQEREFLPRENQEKEFLPRERN